MLDGRWTAMMASQHSDELVQPRGIQSARGERKTCPEGAPDARGWRLQCLRRTHDIAQALRDELAERVVRHAGCRRKHHAIVAGRPELARSPSSFSTTAMN